MKYFKVLLPLALLLPFSACSVMAIKKHNPNFKNVRELESVKGQFFVSKVMPGTDEISVKLGGKSLSCRLTTFNMPADTVLAKFIDDALTDELDAARKLSDKGTGINVIVNKIESDTSGFDKGNWTLQFNYELKGKVYSVNTVTEFESAYSADTACRNTASALTDALTENFLGLYKKLGSAK